MAKMKNLTETVKNEKGMDKYWGKEDIVEESVMIKGHEYKSKNNDEYDNLNDFTIEKRETIKFLPCNNAVPKEAHLISSYIEGKDKCIQNEKQTYISTSSDSSDQEEKCKLIQGRMKEQVLESLWANKDQSNDHDKGCTLKNIHHIIGSKNQPNDANIIIDGNICENNVIGPDGVISVNNKGFKKINNLEESICTEKMISSDIRNTLTNEGTVEDYQEDDHQIKEKDNLNISKCKSRSVYQLAKENDSEKICFTYSRSVDKKDRKVIEYRNVHKLRDCKNDKKDDLLERRSFMNKAAQQFINERRHNSVNHPIQIQPNDTVLLKRRNEIPFLSSLERKRNIKCNKQSFDEEQHRVRDHRNYINYEKEKRDVAIQHMRGRASSLHNNSLLSDSYVENSHRIGRRSEMYNKAAPRRESPEEIRERPYYSPHKRFDTNRYMRETHEEELKRHRKYEDATSSSEDITFKRPVTPVKLHQPNYRRERMNPENGDHINPKRDLIVSKNRVYIHKNNFENQQIYNQDYIPKKSAEMHKRLNDNFGDKRILPLNYPTPMRRYSEYHHYNHGRSDEREPIRREIPRPPVEYVEKGDFEAALGLLRLSKEMNKK